MRQDEIPEWKVKIWKMLFEREKPYINPYGKEESQCTTCNFIVPCYTDDNSPVCSPCSKEHRLSSFIWINEAILGQDD